MLTGGAPCCSHSPKQLSTGPWRRGARFPLPFAVSKEDFSNLNDSSLSRCSGSVRMTQTPSAPVLEPGAARNLQTTALAQPASDHRP